ncbi:acylphosphatase [Barrientosiimonas marina]|uniref:Acylphosphatase n=1 Tax=Lentibacillus kimchii TaxID=1542911 RepID=A0ABW2UWH3_9BACI
MLAHAIVTGQVQGVGFRYTAQQHAEQYNLKGWVQNQPDGSVELEVEGEDSQVESFLQKLRKGFSPSIHVHDIEVTTQQKEQGFRRFSIK